MLRAQYRQTVEELERTKNAAGESEDRFDKLSRFIKDEKLLKERATARQAELKTEIARISEERKKSIEELGGLADDVDLFSRISNRGRAIELARRIASRENRWFLANWQGAEDKAAVEELQGEGLDYDLAKVETAFNRAQEIRRLEKEIAEERLKITDYEQRLRDQDYTVERVPEQPQVDKPAPEKSLWDRLFQ